MNIKKIFALATISTMASFAFADAANTLITFSTPGPDKYADGETTVVDGEIYALVWSADGNFDGFTANGDAANKNEQVIFKAPLAKGGKCPLTLFQIDSKSEFAHDDGTYAVYMLDTRAGKGLVTGAALAKTFGGASGTGNIAAAKTDKTVDEDGNTVALKSGSSALAGDTTAIAPVIKGLQISGAQVTISVGNLVPGLKYTIMGGLDRSETVKSVGFQDATEANIVLESDETFFSIKAE